MLDAAHQAGAKHAPTHADQATAATTSLKQAVAADKPVPDDQSRTSAADPPHMPTSGGQA